MTKVKFPFGNSDNLSGVDNATNTIALVDNAKTILTIPTLAQDTTLNITSILTDLPIGSVLVVKHSSDGSARALILGTGFEAVTQIAGVINEAVVTEFYFDSANFVLNSTQSLA